MLEDLHLRKPYEGFVFLAESVRNPPMLRPHRHVELELNLVVGGEIRYVVDDKSYHFSSGTLLWLFPGQVHQLVDRTPDAAYYVAVFRPEMIQKLANSSRYAPLVEEFPPHGNVSFHRPESGAFQMLRQQLAELCEEGMDPDVLNRESGFGLTPGFHFEHHDHEGLNAGLKHLLLYAWRLSASEKREPSLPSLHPAVRRALEHIRLSDPVHAAGFGSYAQFHRVFHQAYGQSPREALK